VKVSAVFDDGLGDLYTATQLTIHLPAHGEATSWNKGSPSLPAVTGLQVFPHVTGSKSSPL